MYAVLLRPQKMKTVPPKGRITHIAGYAGVRDDTPRKTMLDEMVERSNLAKAENEEGFEVDDSRLVQWQLTEDLEQVLAAPETDVIYDVVDGNHLESLLHARHPAPEGYTFVSRLGCSERQQLFTINKIPQEKRGYTPTLEQFLAVVRQYGEMHPRTHYSELGHIWGSRKRVVLKEYIVSGGKIKYDPVAAEKLLKSQGRKKSLKTTTGRPPIQYMKNLLRALNMTLMESPDLWFTSLPSPISYLTGDKICEEILARVALWRKLYGTDSIWNKSKVLAETMKELQPFVEGMKKKRKEVVWQKVGSMLVNVVAKNLTDGAAFPKSWEGKHAYYAKARLCEK